MSTLSKAKDNNSKGNNTNHPSRNNTTNNPAFALIVTISVQKLQAIQKQISNLQIAVQQNSYCHRQSKFELDYKLAPKRSNLLDKA